nr:Gag-Pol polyprotein [Tanacetum cinerariifolium]
MEAILGNKRLLFVTTAKGKDTYPNSAANLKGNEMILGLRIKCYWIICDLNLTPDLSQPPPQNCPKCGHPVDGRYCQGCALLRKKFKDDLFTYCNENGILQDSSEPSNDDTNVVNALQDPFVVNQDPVKFFHIFGSVCYIVRDGENLDKMKEKGDECIFVGYSTQSRAYRVFNKRTRVIIESIHVNFDEWPQMASVQNSSDPGPSRHSMASVQNSTDPAPTCQTMASAHNSPDPAPTCQTMALEHNSLSPGRNCQENVSHGDKTCTTSNELDLLFSPMFDELLNGSTKVVSKSSAVSAADAPNQRQQPTTPLNNHTTPAPTSQNPPITTTVISSENITQAEPHA